ncbi:uncharacterized protein LOC114516825 [Dendronephthya gigantea]|uniref:uncharacterized protein LOC114516825 n=1 Tax=Dendronephthya gigantea TaxID=151771 RepID=UPI00106B09D9|nr:uncharacterized protein LOC114516825 [Dendronephthya gigantea]
MATVSRKIDWTIRLSALATLILGTLMISSSFRIKYYNEALDSNSDWWEKKNYKLFTKKLMGLYCSTNLFASWIIYWPGIVVVLTSLVILFPNVCRHRRTICNIFVFLSLTATFVLITREASTIDKIRSYDVWTCHPHVSNFYRLRWWYYALYISSYAVLCLCIGQFVAFGAKWILELKSSFEDLIIKNNHSAHGRHHTEQSGEVEEEQEPPSYVGMRVLPTNQPGPPFPYQQPESCCPYHTPQPSSCHHCDIHECYPPVPGVPHYNSIRRGRNCKVMPY